MERHKIVFIDESKFGHKIFYIYFTSGHTLLLKNNDKINSYILSFLVQPRKTEQHSWVGHSWVFGMLGVKEECKRHILRVVNQSSAQHLMPILQKHVRQGSTVVSDGWRAYNCLRDAGYNHLTLNHKEVFVDPRTGAHTQNFERFWGVCKAAVWIFRGNRKENMLKDLLKVIEWTHWSGEKHENGPLGRILHDIRRKYPV